MGLIGLTTDGAGTFLAIKVGAWLSVAVATRSTIVPSLVPDPISKLSKRFYQEMSDRFSGSVQSKK